MINLTITDLEQQAQRQGCPLYVLVDKMVEDYFKKKVKIKIKKPVLN